MKSATPERIYVEQVHLSDICFLDEVLYWVTFQRLPVHFVDSAGNEVRSVVMPGYRVDFDFADERLTDDECERVGLPRDPRNSYEWASKLTLLDDFKKLQASAKGLKEWILSRTRPKRNILTDPRSPLLRESAMGSAAGALCGAPRSEVTKLHNKLERWKPKYKKVIELPAARVYVALREGKLGARGILLPDVDPETALDSLAKQGRDLSNLKDLEIPREFWSEREIFWELSAARNDRAHYCQIHCNTEDVLSLFPCDRLISGTPVTGECFGSFFVLEGLGKGRRVTKRPARQRTRQPGRPQKYPWEEVHLEMASLISSGALPKKKEACIAYIEGWFKSRNQSRPSRAAIGEKLTPYYNRFVRSGRQKTSGPIVVQPLDGAA
jgi:hypothetical protein